RNSYGAVSGTAAANALAAVSWDQDAAASALANPAAMDSTNSRRCMAANVSPGTPSGDRLAGADLPPAGHLDERAVDHLRPLPERLDAHALIIAVHAREVIGVDRIRVDA